MTKSTLSEVVSSTEDIIKDLDPKQRRMSQLYERYLHAINGIRKSIGVLREAVSTNIISDTKMPEITNDDTDMAPMKGDILGNAKKTPSYIRDFYRSVDELEKNLTTFEGRLIPIIYASHEGEVIDKSTLNEYTNEIRKMTDRIRVITNGLKFN